MGKKKNKRMTDPRAELYFGEGGRDSRSRRKDAQLCAQVRDALDLALGSMTDGDLAQVWVSEVEPAPHVGHLRVVVEVSGEVDLGVVSEKLAALEGTLRFEVANAIHRKKTPSLTFVVLPPREDQP